jgi:hypothetical protein
VSTTFSGGPAVSDTVTISGLGSIISGAYSAPSTLVDNTPAGPRSIAYLNGLLRLTFSSPLTAGAGSPNIWVYRLVAADGTNLPNPPGASAAAPSPTALASVAAQVASGSFSVVDFGPFEMEPFKYGFQMLNNAGVTFSGTVALTLYRWTPIGA